MRPGRARYALDVPRAAARQQISSSADEMRKRYDPATFPPIVRDSVQAINRRGGQTEFKSHGQILPIGFQDLGAAVDERGRHRVQPIVLLRAQNCGQEPGCRTRSPGKLFAITGKINVGGLEGGGGLQLGHGGGVSWSPSGSGLS